MRTLIFLTCLTASFSLYGQGEEQEVKKDTLKITFKEAVEVALKENVPLRQQQNLLEVNEANRLAQKFRYLPTVSISGQYTRTDGQQFDQVQGVLAFTQSDRVSGSLDANLTLFDGLNRINSIKAADYSFKSQQSAVETRKQQLIYDVAQQYLQILLDTELLKIASDNLAVQQTTLEQIEGFVEVGSRAKPDLYTQEAQVQQAAVLKINAENTLRRSKTALIQTLLLNPTVDIEVVTPEWEALNILNQTYELNKLYSLALNNRPDYKQAQYTVEANNSNMSAASSGYFPTLTAFFSYGSNYSSLVANSTYTETNQYETIGYVNGDENMPVQSINPVLIASNNEVPFDNQFFDDNLTTYYGLNLRIPIFDGLQTRAQRMAAKIDYENSKLDEENLERTIFLNVQNAFLDFKAAKENYMASQKQFEAGKKAQEVQQERYDLGIGDLVELSQANNLYVQGAASKAQATFTLIFQKIIIDYNLGTLKFEDIP